MDILQLIRKALHERLDLPEDQVTLEARLEDLGVDSLGLVELGFELEDHLGIRLPQDYATPVTVGDMVKIVGDVVKQKQESAA